MILRFLFATFALLCWVPASAQGVPPQQEYYVGRGEVDLFRGTFLYGSEDISIGPDGPGQLKLTRRHGVREGNGPFSGTTGHNYEVRLYRQGFVQEPNGPNQKSYRYHLLIGDFVETFQKDYGTSTVYYTGSSPGTHVLSLSSETGPFTYTGPDGLVIEFTALGTYSQCQLVGFQTVSCGPAASLTYPDGSRLDFAYDVASPGYARLRLVTNNWGYALGFNYTASSPLLLLEVCAVNLAANYVTASSPCPAGVRKAQYSYASNQLATYIDSASKVTSYTHTMGLHTITSPGSASPDVTIDYYPLSGKVQMLTYADGSTVQYSYTFNDDLWINAPFNDETVVTVSGSGITKHRFLGPASKPTRITDPLNRETNFSYSWAGLASVLARKTLPEGNYTHDTYGTRANVTETRVVAKPGTGLPDIVSTAIYPSTCTQVKTCDKPTSQTDAKGNTTDYTYDNAHGGVLTVRRPAPNGSMARPLTLTTYVQKYAYIKNSGGSLVAVATPVWLPASVTICQTVSGANPPATCDPAAPQTVTAFEYGANGTANNLLARGMVVTVNGTSRRTCIGYDMTGNVIWRTAARAGLTGCP